MKPIPTRASDSFRFTRRDQDSLRSGIQTHPGIDENGVLAMAVPRTNRLSLLTLTGTGLRIRWSGVRIPPGAPLSRFDSRARAGRIGQGRQSNPDVVSCAHPRSTLE